jgi:hypothetical protein
MRRTSIQRVIARLRYEGWKHVEKLRRWSGTRSRRYHAFGFIDVLALAPSGARLAVHMVEAAGELFARAGTVASMPQVQAWLAGGGLLELWAWTRDDRDGRRLVPVRHAIEGIAHPDPAAGTSAA